MNDDDDLTHDAPGLHLWARRLADAAPVPEPSPAEPDPTDLRAAACRFQIPEPYTTTVLGALSRYLQATCTDEELCAIRADSAEVVSFLRAASRRILN